MAKTCPVCHQTYADHLQACPHCAKEREEDSSVIRLHDPGHTADGTDSPSSSSDERRGDVITIGPEEPSSSTEDSSIRCDCPWLVGRVDGTAFVTTQCRSRTRTS